MYKLKSTFRVYYFLALLFFVISGYAEEQNVNPNINQHYSNPDFNAWRNIFESPGREVYDKRFEILKKANLQPGMVVADIGAGSGLFTRLFSKQVGATGKVIAVDVSSVFIDNILRICKEQGLDNVEGVVNTQKDVMLKSESIDVAFISDSYHHFEYPKTTLASIYRALRPMGELIVIDFKKQKGVSSSWVMGHVRSNKDSVIKEIESAGFKLKQDDDFLKVNYYLRFQKK